MPDQAIEKNKMFILDHHDALMPYLRRINTTTTKTYATRTILLLQADGTLKPLAIELSLPHENGDALGAISQVFTPCDHGVGNAIWQLAKAYVAVNDSGYHQLISHWYVYIAYNTTFDATMMNVFISVCRLNTHAVIEPFVIATNRQLSTLHPIHKLLKPHFRDTIHINALARQILINAGGVLEITVFPARYAMEMSSFVYRNWNFTEQALPVDLIKRLVITHNQLFETCTCYLTCHLFLTTAEEWLFPTKAIPTASNSLSKTTLSLLMAWKSGTQLKLG